MDKNYELDGGIKMKFLLFFLFISTIISGCSALEDLDCSGDSGNYKNEVDANTYFSFEKHQFSDEVFNYEKNKTEYQTYSVYFKKILELFDDSTFMYSTIWEHYSDSNNIEIVVDTVEYMSGTFSIRPVNEKKWHSFVLKSDSLFFRWRFAKENYDLRDGHYKYTYTYNLIIDEKYHSEPFIAQHDSILLNVDLQDSCFTLAEWYQEPDDISFSCSDPYISKTRTFCANSSYKDSSIVGVVIQ